MVFFGSVCELRSLFFVSSKFMHYAAFHQDLHCLQRQNRSSEKNNIFGEIITYDPSIYTIDHPDSNVSNFMENSIALKRVNPPSTWVCCSFLGKDSIVIDSLLTLKAPITTAADDKCCEILPNFQKNKV